MFRFFVVALQAARARLFMITMLIAHQAVHTAWRKHTLIAFFFGHFHKHIILFWAVIVKFKLRQTKKADRKDTLLQSAIQTFFCG